MQYDLMSAAGGPVDLSAPHPGGEVMLITADYLLADGQALDLHGPVGLKLVVKNTGPITLTIDGDVDVAAKAKAPLDTVIGLTTTHSINGQATIALGATSNFTVSAVGGDAFGIKVYATGTVLTLAGAATVTSAKGQATLVQAEVDGVSLDNSGHITVTTRDTAQALVFLGDNEQVTNDGTIAVTGALAIGVGIYGFGESFTNNGAIMARGTSGLAGGAWVTNGDAVNHGDIRVHGSGAVYGLVAFHGSSFLNDGSIVVSNHGGGDQAIAVMASLGVGASDFVNSGLIKGPMAIASTGNYTGPDDADHWINTGRVIGGVFLNKGDDSFVNAGGVVRGDVDMGLDDDTYDGRDGRQVGTVRGGVGDDTLFGGGKSDHLAGDAIDTGLGGGADMLRGMGGDDTLEGGAGDDLIVGGKGADAMTGGDGADVFLFRTVRDSGPLAADHITDLQAGDVIDLSEIDADVGGRGDDAFHLVVSFSHAAGELTVGYDSLTDLTTFAGDIDGDGDADLVITAAGDQSGFAGLVL